MKCVLGIDIGGTKSAVILADQNGKIINRIELPTLPEPELFLTKLSNCAHTISNSHNLQAIGISCGGPLNRKTGTILTPPNLPLWKDVPITKYFEDQFSVKVVLENDANASAFAELRWGAGKGLQHIAFLTWGTGIGAGLILNGEIYHGKNDLAGEIGHIKVTDEHIICKCGKLGCLEAVASGPAIAKQAKEMLVDFPSSRLSHLNEITCKDVIEAANVGDELPTKVLAEAGKRMGTAIAGLLHTLDLEAVALGTVAIHAQDFVMKPLLEELKIQCWPGICNATLVVPSYLGFQFQDCAALSLVS